MKHHSPLSVVTSAAFISSLPDEPTCLGALSKARRLAKLRHWDDGTQEMVVAAVMRHFAKRREERRAQRELRA